MQHTDSTVSILIPAYKPEWFAQCLESCLNQSHAVHEIIISDDCRTDAIATITTPFLGNPRVRYVRNQPSLGLAANYLQLARMTSARWLKYCDDDDVLHPDCLQRLMQHTHANVSLVLGGCNLVHENGSVREKIEPLPPLTAGMEYFLHRYHTVPLTLFTRMLVRGDVLQQMLTDTIPARMISLDELVGLRACLAGDIAWEQSIVCDHRNFSGGYSRNVEPDVLLDDLAYVTNPFAHALAEDLASRSELLRWRTRMVRKYARGVITKFIQQKNPKGLYTFMSKLHEQFGFLALRCAASPRLLVKFAKSFFR